jgi:hypothetical protein
MHANVATASSFSLSDFKFTAWLSTNERGLYSHDLCGLRGELNPAFVNISSQLDK